LHKKRPLVWGLVSVCLLDFKFSKSCFDGSESILAVLNQFLNLIVVNVPAVADVGDV